MEGEASRGRGRGRGMVPGSNEERGDLRRPLATPQELSVGGMQQAQQQNPMMANNAYNDTIANAQITAAQMKQYQENLQLQQIQQQHMRQNPQPPQAQGQTQQHDPRLQAQITLASQQSPQLHMLPIQLQQQQQQQQQHQQQLQQQQQMSMQQQLAQLHAQQLQQQQTQQILQLGLQPNTRNVTYLSPQKQQEYEDLSRRKAELEMILQQKNQLQQQQQQQQQQHQQQLQQLLMRNQTQQQNLEIEQKLAQLQIQNPNAVYLQTQQQQQQHQIQQQLHQQLLHKQQQQLQQLALQKQYVQAAQQQQQENMSHANVMHAASEQGKSVLSAEAAEFVPRFGSSSVPQRSDHSPSPSLTNHHMSPGMNLPPASSSGPPEHQSLIPIQPEYSCHPVVVQVDTAVVQLSGNPSKYEAISRQLTSVLSWQVKEENLMREVVTVIFEQGVGEANFRFTGGKLCEHLVKNVAQQYNGPSFKSILLQRCQEEFEYRHEYLTVLFYDRLIGYSFFLAEILTRLLMPSGQPITKLREALCEMLTILLDVSTSESLKCVAQVLKMSGRYLEMGGSAEFEVVMTKLRDIAMTPLPPNTKTLLTSVVEFRAANWGCPPETEGEEGGEGSAGEGENSAKDAAGGRPAVNGEDLPVLGTIFYGPGGVIHHIEEDCPEDCPSDSDDASAKLAAAPQVCELEGEEGAAFDQFLQSMN